MHHLLHFFACTHCTRAAHLFAVIYRSVIVDQQPKVKVCKWILYTCLDYLWKCALVGLSNQCPSCERRVEAGWRKREKEERERERERERESSISFPGHSRIHFNVCGGGFGHETKQVLFFLYIATESVLCYQWCVHHHLCLWYVVYTVVLCHLMATKPHSHSRNK